MMKKTFMLCLLCISELAIGGEFSQLGTIEKTYTSSSWTQVALTGSEVNPDGCVSTAYYAIDTTAQNYDAILSSILAAQMAQKTVRFFLSSCAGSDAKYPKIISIQVMS